MCKLAVRAVTSLCVVALAHPHLARAWGNNGHKIVAMIAVSQLDPPVAAKVMALLKHDPTGKSLPAVATWADSVRHTTRPETEHWHFVDIPVDGTVNTYDPARDCKPDPKGDCIIKAIERELPKLTNTSLSERERSEALKFIVHFVGDLHQPLHCAERNNDNGGGQVTVIFLNQTGHNLHSVWDSAILDNAGLSQTAYANKLIKALPSNLTVMEAGTTVDWANESHALAVDKAYTNTDGSPVVNGTKLKGPYVKDRTKIVNQQLTRAGVRLAKVLNDTLR